MAFDGLVLYTLVEEMRDRLITARVDKIHQPDPDTITIAMRARGENVVLLISTNPQYARVNFSTEKFINPPHPPTFCMLLRKHLAGGRVIEINQPGFERILHIVIQNLNEFGEVVHYRLVAELMGRHSNLILVGENDLIMDSIRRIPSGVSRLREVLPGRPYANPPEQDKANPLMAEEGSFKALLQLDPELKIAQAIMNNYRGISPLVAKEIALRSGINPDERIKDISWFDSLWMSFSDIFADLKNRKTSPNIVEDAKGKVLAYYCFSLLQYAGYTEKSFPTMHDLLDYYFGIKLKRQALDQMAGELKKTVSNLLDKDLKKRDKLHEQLNEAENSEEYRIKGEMLTANIHLVKKGSTKFTTANYYEPDLKEITIELDPAISPQVNAQKYFKRYNKLKNSISYVKQELEKLAVEIEYLRNVELSLEQIESRMDVEEIRQELIEEGYLKEKRKSTPNRMKIKYKPMKFVSSDGFDIFVGRNNLQNDELTKKLAMKDDLWFHVKEIPGSHVVIRNYDRVNIPDNTIVEAAVLAAYFSKARESKKVQVDYTKVKYVSKPNGAKPGMVIYENYQTIVIDPDVSLMEKLKAPAEEK